MSEKTSGSMPPSVPPSVPPARSTTSSTAAPPTRVSASSYGAAQDELRATDTGRTNGVRQAVSADSGDDSPAEPTTSKPRPPGPRRVRLAISRVDPWSVMKLSFLLSIAVGIGIVIATATVWTVLNQMGVFASINEIVDEIDARNQFGTVLEFLEFSRVLSVSVVIAVVDIVLLTALATLGAFIYNLVAAMVGGLHLTLTDD